LANSFVVHDTENFLWAIIIMKMFSLFLCFQVFQTLLEFEILLSE